jgi:hypothetical protein
VKLRIALPYVMLILRLLWPFDTGGWIWLDLELCAGDLSSAGYRSVGIMLAPRWYSVWFGSKSKVWGHWKEKSKK